MNRRAERLARLLLTVAVVLPYWRLLTFSVIFVTDDRFASDVFNGELPARVIVGQLLRAGHLPVWTSAMCSGYPLTGTPADPLGLALFALLPPAVALDALILVLLMVAAHGAYALARRFGADVIGATLAGTAFAGSGYIAAQLKHLSIVSTVVWLPIGLLLIDHALAPGSRRRWTVIAAFGLVFAEQVLSGFPQSAYIAALTYGAFTLFRGILTRAQHPGERVYGPLTGLAGAVVLGAASGAALLLPLSALGTISDRAEPLGYEWSTRLAYWVPNAQTFLLPYIHGDISDNTYVGASIFWEDYGYVGGLTLLLALYAAFRDRRRPVVVFTFLMTLLAYLFVLGRATPVFYAAYVLVPGMKLFRFPTRFLIVVDMGLALLGALGLSRLRADLAARWAPPSRIPSSVAIALCALTALDLLVHQPRQNPMVDAATWLAPPATVGLVRSSGVAPRTFTPRHRDMHRRVFEIARGWADVTPYYELRDVIQPNLGAGYWNVPSGDCYVGISPRWYVDVWGDHSRELSLMALLASNDYKAGLLRIAPNLASVLSAYGVTHLISSYPLANAQLPFVGRSAHAYVYRIDGAARVRLVAGATVMPDAQAAKRLLDPAFDPSREVLLQDAPATISPRAGDAITGANAGRASLVREEQTEITIDTESGADQFLLLADTFYPGWTAQIDGAAVPIYRANLSVRAIAVPKGRHRVRFFYDPPGYRAGLAVSGVALAVLAGWLAAALYRGRRTPLTASP